MHVHSPPMNTHMQILHLWISSKTKSANPRDWRSHHMCLTVDGKSPTTESTTPLNPRIFDPTRTTGTTEAWNHQTIYRPFCNNNFSSRICFLAIHPMTSKLYYVVLQARKRVNMFFNFCTLFNFKFSICNTPTFLCSLISPFKWHDESQPNVLCTSTKVVEDRNQVEVWWS